MIPSETVPGRKGPRLYGIGQEAEQELARMLGRRGYTVITISQYTNNTGAARNAPMLVTDDGYSISPDMMIMKNGKSFWAEVKHKSVPAYYFKWHCWVHGVDKPNIDAYRKAQQDSGYPVFVCVLEDRSPLTTDLYLEWFENSPDGRAVADLCGPRQWLWITLDDAFKYGQFMPNNSEMVSDRNPDGLGLYWPRHRMLPFKTQGLE